MLIKPKNLRKYIAIQKKSITFAVGNICNNSDLK